MYIYLSQFAILWIYELIHWDIEQLYQKKEAKHERVSNGTSDAHNSNIEYRGSLIHLGNASEHF